MRRERRKKKNDSRRPDSGRRCGTAQTGMPETGASAAMRRTDSSPKPRTQVGRPGDPATRRPGDPATRRPGDPATRRPGDPAGLILINDSARNKPRNQLAFIPVPPQRRQPSTALSNRGETVRQRKTASRTRRTRTGTGRERPAIRPVGTGPCGGDVVAYAPLDAVTRQRPRVKTHGMAARHQSLPENPSRWDRTQTLDRSEGGGMKL